MQVLRVAHRCASSPETALTTSNDTIVQLMLARSFRQQDFDQFCIATLACSYQRGHTLHIHIDSGYTPWVQRQVKKSKGKTVAQVNEPNSCICIPDLCVEQT